MAEPFNTLKKSLKIKKELITSKSSLNSVNMTLSDVNSVRLSFLPGLKAQKLTTDSSEKFSFISEKDDTSYDSYEVDYSMYLLRKLHNRILLQNKREKEEKFKVCLISLKLELEELLNKYIELNKSLAFINMYVDTIRECNKRIEARSILKIFEDNKLDIMFHNLSNFLNKSVNKVQLAGISKNEVEKLFTNEFIGDNSELNECLNRIQNSYKKNGTVIEKISEEITKIEQLQSENLLLRERYQCMFNSITSDICETDYEIFSDIFKKICDRRSKQQNISSSDDSEILKLEELFQVASRSASNEQMNSLQLSGTDSLYSAKPSSTSTPQFDYLKN